MRRIFGVVFLLCAVVAAVLLPVSASALSVSGQRIIITAEVLPVRDIIVNQQGVIQQIISNNNLPNIVPTVYKNTTNPANQIPLSANVSHQYAVLMHDKPVRPGILYSYAPKPPKPNHSNPLARIAIMRLQFML